MTSGITHWNNKKLHRITWYYWQNGNGDYTVPINRSWPEAIKDRVLVWDFKDWGNYFFGAHWDRRGNDTSSRFGKCNVVMVEDMVTGEIVYQENK